MTNPIYNDALCSRIESVQYNAALAITGAIKGTSRERLYHELGLESLRDRRWYRRLTYFFNIVSFKGELRAKFYPNFFFIYRFVYAYYNVVQNFIIFGKGLRKL